MSSTVEISIVFLEGVNARLRELARNGQESTADSSTERRPIERAARLLRPLLNSGTTVSFLAVLASCVHWGC
ncbi:MAG: hypothetical protein ACK5Q5_22000 [Planctomycetaceae bacterium]